MPRETYLPTGMRGLITCPFLANPPLLHVDWTKDGAPLDVTLVSPQTPTELDPTGLDWTRLTPCGLIGHTASLQMKRHLAE